MTLDTTVPNNVVGVPRLPEGCQLSSAAIPNEHYTDEYFDRWNYADRGRGLFFFVTPHPEYVLRRFKDRATDAIGKDKTHINCQVPATWKAWCEQAGLRVERQFGDGLWDVPYMRVIPAKVQLALFGWPGLVQLLTRTTFMPVALGVNHINIVRKRG